MILAVSGDVGGMKALIPVLDRMIERDVDFKVVAHRGLEEYFIDRAIEIDILNDEFCDQVLDSISTLIFTTSVKDEYPLRLAKRAKAKGVYLISLLDNWMNYKIRFKLNEEFVFPDKYCVMDHFAYKAAVMDGIPECI